VAADSAAPLLQVRYGSERLLDGSSNEITIGSRRSQEFYTDRSIITSNKDTARSWEHWVLFLVIFMFICRLNQPVDPGYHAMTGYTIESQ
jgi:hypothetical protein